MSGGVGIIIRADWHLDIKSLKLLMRSGVMLGIVIKDKSENGYASFGSQDPIPVSKPVTR